MTNISYFQPPKCIDLLLLPLLFVGLYHNRLNTYGFCTVGELVGNWDGHFLLFADIFID